MGLGLVLMLAGDGDVARRAGDALIQDKVDDALTEGGFDLVRFAGWEKGFDGGRFWLGFSGVEVARDGAELSASGALIYPMSIELQFDRGRVTTGPDSAVWLFSGVDVHGSFSFFSKRIGIRGVELRLTGEPGVLGDPFCVFGEQCERPVAIEDGRLDTFRLDFSRSGRSATVAFAWRSGSRCVAALLDEVQIPRGAALSEIGARLLGDEYDGQLRLSEGHCSQVLEGKEEFDKETVVSGRWSSRDETLDPMLHVLLVSVPEAYEYLVE